VLITTSTATAAALGDLDHETVAYPAHTGLDAPLATVRYAHRK
jgi:hypothetical protein